MKKFKTKVKRPTCRQRQAKMGDLYFAYDKLNSGNTQKSINPEKMNGGEIRMLKPNNLFNDH